MSPRLPALALAATLAAGLLAPAAVHAQAPAADSATVRAREQQLRLEAAKRRELDEINQQARASREQASRLKGKETKALGQLRRTQREFGLTRRRLRTLQNRRSALGQQLGVTRETLQQTLFTLGQQKAKLARRLRNMYKAGADRELEFLLSTDSFAQLLARWDFVVMVASRIACCSKTSRARRSRSRPPSSSSRQTSVRPATTSSRRRRRTAGSDS
jgi:septal ring factor EnvC (AmiA/AmiB activator)